MGGLNTFTGSKQNSRRSLLNCIKGKMNMCNLHTDFMKLRNIIILNPDLPLTKDFTEKLFYPFFIIKHNVKIMSSIFTTQSKYFFNSNSY